MEQESGPVLADTQLGFRAERLAIGGFLVIHVDAVFLVKNAVMAAGLVLQLTMEASDSSIVCGKLDLTSDRISPIEILSRSRSGKVV